jgi:hypothetical protein
MAVFSISGRLVGEHAREPVMPADLARSGDADALPSIDIGSAPSERFLKVYRGPAISAHELIKRTLRRT